jgi:hypothetical protein
MEVAQVTERTVWSPQDGPQTALLGCPIFEVFFGGARGGGKTDGMLGEWISHQDMHGKYASGLMIRRTLRDLEDTIKRSKAIYTQLGAVFGEQDKVWKFPNGSEIKFRYLESDKDADNYQGHSYTRVYFEELTQFPLPDPVMKLMATLRSAQGVPCGFRATGNPGGPGHGWVRQRYIDPEPLGWKTISQDYKNPWNGNVITRQRVFIPSKLTDNKYLGDEYVANLMMSGGEKLVRAWLEGDWTGVEGAFFEEFSIIKHVIRPFEIPAGWVRFRAADWGSAKPFCIGWYAVVGDDYTLPEGFNQRRILPRGAIIKYREWYGSANHDNKGLKITAESVADGILAREIEEPRSLDGLSPINYSVIDPAAFSSDGGPSIAERMSTRGVYFNRADNSRVGRNGAMGGWDMIRHRLIGEPGPNGDVPMIYFFSNCLDTIRTFPSMQHDPAKVEDIQTDSEDHALDETRYACLSRPYIRSAPVEKPEKILSTDPAACTLTLTEVFEDNERQQKRSGGRI